MKVKLLIFPLSVATSLALGIWKIQPEIDHIMGAQQEISDQQVALDEAIQKVKNADALSGELDAHKDLERMVLNYLPASQDQERMMDALNYLASQSGVALLSAKMSADKDSSETALSVDNSDAAAGAESASTPTPKKLPETIADVSLKGEYANIRDFMQKVSHTGHANEFSSIEIKRASIDASEQQDSNLLEASMKVGFSHFSKGKSSDKVDPTLFAQSTLNFKPAQELQKYISSPLPELSLDGAGKSNPFTR